MKEIRIIIIIIPEILFEREYYFQRKHKEKYKFPLVISTFLPYFQRKHKEKHYFPLVIGYYNLENYDFNTATKLNSFTG